MALRCWVSKCYRPRGRFHDLAAGWPLPATSYGPGLHAVAYRLLTWFLRLADRKLTNRLDAKGNNSSEEFHSDLGKISVRQLSDRHAQNFIY